MINVNASSHRLLPSCPRARATEPVPRDSHSESPLHTLGGPGASGGPERPATREPAARGREEPEGIPRGQGPGDQHTKVPGADLQVHGLQPGMLCGWLRIH